MSLKATDLRIGALVDIINRQHEVHLPTGYVFRVIAVGLFDVQLLPNEILTHEATSDIILTVPIKDLLGISLTEELLLKCGFKNKVGVFKHTGCDIIQIYPHEGKFNIFVKGNKQNGSSVLGSNLHELQNLFKVLTREELQIEL
jgi:hypothetical protein